MWLKLIVRYYLKIKEEQWDLQRIIWRFNTHAAYLIIWCLQELGWENWSEQPEIGRIILKNFYIENVQSRSNSAEGTKKINKLSKVFEKAGFVCLFSKDEVLEDEMF